MIKHLPAAALLLTLSLAGCSPKTDDAQSANVLAENDFDHLDGWAGDLPALATLSKTKAHSGAYSTSVRPGFDYSLGFSNVLGKLTDRRPQKITISAWVMLPNDQANARLVVEIKDPNKSDDLLYKALELRSVVKKYNEWQQVEQTIEMPATAAVTSRLLVYLWRADSNEPVYLDDMKISRVD
ncbi:hypothetical protein SAMN02745146_2898 [Hymenobacter daecheongensis DSM 21074]|uniref:CBM-cenC domain-containing protein n=1 Tax=Hymenobacter daecheongensis DSM 21074 TaxID=1121955 RepID=A0A1M6IMM7_9BACT|nr:carbohydrate binding domain-containing protein [Hymenobacter daecheongensis]SHJ35599.1 hypothetical protein SAMN02745146_2898 [Hymenobacter daecheongensis DSM 21074]